MTLFKERVFSNDTYRYLECIQKYQENSSKLFNFVLGGQIKNNKMCDVCR